MPEEARGFIAGFSEAQDQGRPFDEMFAELAEEWQVLMDWKRSVAESLPGRRGAGGGIAAPGSPGPSPNAAQAP